MPKPKLIALLLVISSLTLAACGQKGPLTLPADSPDEAQALKDKKNPNDSEM